MGIKKIGLGRRTAAAGAAAEVAAPGGAAFAAAGAARQQGGLGQTPVEMMSGWLMRMPFSAQQRALTVGRGGVAVGAARLRVP